LAAHRHSPVKHVDKSDGQPTGDAAMTTVYELTPPPERPTRRDEPPITVRAAPTGVIIQLHPGRLDACATAALVTAINAAVGAGTAVLIDLEGGPPDRLDNSSPPPHRCGLDPTEAPSARMVSPGYVELAAGDEPWLLDVVGRRLSRTRVDDRLFLPVNAWLPVRAVTVSAATVRAVTCAGDLIVVYRSG
jgi:hypothetical protein